MDVKLTWNENLVFTGTNKHENRVTLDASEINTGFTPMELMALGTAGCTSMDVVSILRKKKVPFTGYDIKVHVESAEEHPKVFTLMELEYIITGKGINRADVERAVQLSEEKYCQGIAMMRKTAEIRSKVTIIEE